MEISEDQFENNFKGFILVDCAARSREIFYFSLCEDEAQPSAIDADDDAASFPRRRIVYYIKNLPEPEQWGHGEFANSYDRQLSVSRKPREQLISVDKDGEVHVLGGGVNEMEKSLGNWLDGGILRGGIARCKTIDGLVYAVGGGRTVALRQARNQWSALMQGLPFDYDTDWQTAGFDDIDGFDANDLYCVGGKGDVWHFDGNSWTQINFPSNISLSSVCCAGDGDVYISAYQGSIFKGRGQRWKQIYKGELRMPFRDLVWHEGQVWCTSDYGLWQLAGGKLVAAPVDHAIAVCAGHLSSCADVLLLAGHSGAAYRMDGAWHKIF
jgi:hypothetical protein